ncbi:MAG TPA: hypothetical protein VF796_29420, partial [Humisphaera sp.]
MRPLPSRREALLAAASAALLARLGAPLRAGPPDNPRTDNPGTADTKPADPVAAGRRFLESLFDPALDLLPEFRGAKVYWLFH